MQLTMQITMHKDNLHIGDVEHRDVHNLNGALVHMATVQGLEERGRAIFGSDGDRPFVLSRSFFAGSQRSGPIWTGDNAATWEHLRLSVPMLLSISIAGLPFAGMLFCAATCHSIAGPFCCWCAGPCCCPSLLSSIAGFLLAGMQLLSMAAVFSLNACSLLFSSFADMGCVVTV